MGFNEKLNATPMIESQNKNLVTENVPIDKNEQAKAKLDHRS